MKIIKHPELKFKPMQKVEKSEKRYIVTHHPEAKVSSPAQIHAWHLSRGWSGAGYHFLIRKDGTVHELRPTLTVGAHCPTRNKDGIGVCWEGNWHVETQMPKVQFNAGVELYKYLMKEYNILLKQVIRHCDARPTNCPGKNFPWRSLIVALKESGNGGEIKGQQQKKTEVLTSICGITGITKEQAITHINSVNSDCKISCSLYDLVEYYFDYCKKYSIKTEIAIAQMLLETNYLRFGGIVQAGQNNFAGIGALDGNGKGQAATFKTAKIGVLAQIQHLFAYASVNPISARGIVDPRFGLVVRGSAPYVEYLSIPHNPSGGGWASDKDYAIKIKAITHKIDAVKIQKEHWGAKYVKELQKRNLLSEWHNPDDKVTWAELGVIVSKLMQEQSK